MMNGFVFSKGLVFTQGFIYSVDDFKDIFRKNHFHAFGCKKYEHPKLKGKVTFIYFRKKNIYISFTTYLTKLI